MTPLFVEDGMTTQQEREWLYEQAKGKSHIVEIGAWKGNTTRYLADACLGRVYCVDVWRLCEGTIHLKALYDKPLDYLFEAFMESVGQQVLDGGVVPICLPSTEAARYFPDGSLDMIFIDADHHYEAVKADILAWRPKLKPGGLFCGHDMLGHPGVEQAVKELLPEHKLGPGNSLWYL